MKTSSNSRIFAAMFAAYVGAIAFPGPAQAEIADLSNVPLANSPSDAVLPNLMYILDDSGSMRWDYMPDNVHYRSTSSNQAVSNCKDTSGTVAAVQCADAFPANGYSPSTWYEPPFATPDFNQIFYNPDIYYAAAVDAGGVSKGDSVYTAAPKDGYNDATTVNLSTGFGDVYYCANKSAQFTGKIGNATMLGNGTILTVTAVAAGKLKVGDIIESPATANTKIVSQTSGTTGGVGVYTVDISQLRGTLLTTVSLTVAMPANPVAATLADNTVCRRNGIDNKDATYGYFMYWSTSTTTGGLPYAGFTNKKISTGNGHYYRITAHEYCKDDNLWDCALANADGTAPNNFTIPAPLRYCNTTAQAGSATAQADAVGSATHKCQADFDYSNYRYPRYGRFKRVNLDLASYTKGVNAVRPDCTSATVCTLAEEQKNFANWYTWYRTRLTMMKTATGRAFVDINDRYRVGFITINAENGGTDVLPGVTYLPIAKFEATQKAAFYSILYSQTNHGGTPLRAALARVGRHYAGIKTGINSGMPEDPITHSCQQNFSLLTTDGYWNDNDTDAQNIAGNQVGNQDNVPSTTTPIYVSRATVTIDGQNTQEQVATPFVVTEQAKCSGNNSINWGDGGASATQACGCAAGSNQTRIWQRTKRQVTTESFTGGQSTGSTTTNVSGSETFTLITDCTTPLVTTQVTPKVDTERMVCQYQNNTAFGGNTGTQQSCGCSATSGSNKYRLKERKKLYDQTIVTTDGVAAAPTNGTATYQFANINPTPSNTCLTSSPSGTVSPATTANGTPIPAPTSNGGTNLAVTFTPTSVQNGSPTTTTVTAAGFSNTLADVAMYYYKTDLRSTMVDNVPTNDKDVAPHQHMTTFTLGLGLRGLVGYQTNYETAATGDFANIRAATIGACSWIASGSRRCDWPQPASGTSTTLDDLWHAAVNGRGIYYSAGDPNQLSDGLTSALSALKVQTAAASASATSSPNITETENFIYSSTFRTVLWDGEVSAQRIDATTGAVIPTVEWSAQQKLDTRIKTVVNPGDSDDRLIYTFESANANGRKEFFYDQLTSTVGSTTEKSWFDNKCTALSQCAGLSTAQKNIANDGKSLVNYLRGRSEFAVAPANSFRTREHVLGDPINATPAFISRPHFGFVDTVAETYADFKTAQNARQGVLYIAANDGMLHALNGDTGVELWSYVPRIVFPRLHKIASEQWTVNHEYSVDGSPQIMDIFDDGLKKWKTILVAGLNKGGQGYYALDITNPVSAGPLPMWEICADTTVCEITDKDLGYTYGNPVITKRASDGKWVVIVTSGMNNNNTGTGRGYLYVLDALTGQVLDKVEAIDGATTWGDTTTPSGLSKISAFANSFNTDNTATFVYGGDLYGNVWRFDMSESPPKVLKLAQLTDASGKPQSVTSRPELGIISGNRVIFIGTGRYLGQTDLSDPASLLPALGWAYQQSFYAFKDKDAGYGGNIRTSTPGLVKQTISETAGVRTTSTNPVKWDSTNDGWYVDFNPGTAPGLSPGERVNLDPQLILGTLVVVTNVPNKDACSTGGDSFLYQFDYRSGSYISTSANNAVAQKFTGKITVGVVIVRLPKGIFKGIVTGASGQKTSTGVNLGSGGGTGRRVSWRELIP